MSIYYMQDPQDDNIGHFTLIKNLSWLAWTLTDGTHNWANNGKKYICDRYVYHIVMNTFVSFSTAKNNKTFFFIHAGVYIILIQSISWMLTTVEHWTTAPSDCQAKRISGSTLKIKATRSDFPSSYADLECVLRKTEYMPDTEHMSYMSIHQHHYYQIFYVRCSYR